eukprot:1954785-Rhodomonas_salina.1
MKRLPTLIVTSDYPGTRQESFFHSGALAECILKTSPFGSLPEDQLLRGLEQWDSGSRMKSIAFGPGNRVPGYPVNSRRYPGTRVLGTRVPVDAQCSAYPAGDASPTWVPATHVPGYPDTRICTPFLKENCVPEFESTRYAGTRPGYPPGVTGLHREFLGLVVQVGEDSRFLISRHQSASALLLVLLVLVLHCLFIKTMQNSKLVKNQGFIILQLEPKFLKTRVLFSKIVCTRFPGFKGSLNWHTCPKCVSESNDSGRTPQQMWLRCDANVLFVRCAQVR